MNCIVSIQYSAFGIQHSAFGIRHSSERVVRAQRGWNLCLRQLRGEVFTRVDEPVRFELVLLVVQSPVAAAERYQLRVAPALDDLAMLEHQDLIGAPYRR